MKLHEFETKELFKREGITVPEGKVLESRDQLDGILNSLKGPPWVLKAQIHAGGRGKAGGIRVAKDREDAFKGVGELLEKRLVTAQTGKDGVVIKKLLVEEFTPHIGEYYLGITLDRSKALPALILSTRGGMEIEEVAREDPRAVSKIWVNPLWGFSPYKAREILFGVDPMPDPELHPPLESLFRKLYQIFWKYDCSLVEINPLAILEDKRFVALDAKMSIDDNALFRHKEFQEDHEGKDPLELEAQSHGLSYIRMNGDVGVMVNGAGLAMATMDIIKLAGREPANFLDVGGGASQETVRRGFEIILKDPRVRTIFVNIFGGILRCDVLARGMVEALSGIDLRVPMVVRLEE
ncbi:MAG: ADP-forming succinate--CoA ligase subunit beta, partial [Desulfatiglandales bacterium]